MTMTLIYSCSTENDLSDFEAAAQGELIATVNGRGFKATMQTATLFNGIFNITAMNISTGEVLMITLSDAAESTFDLGLEGTQNGAVFTLNNETSYTTIHPDGSGEITISELNLENETASGTFSFKGVMESFDGNKETIEITNGAFNKIPMIVEIPGDGSSTLTAKIDGSTPNFDSVHGTSMSYDGSPAVMINALSNSTYQNISLRFPKDVTPGSFELSDGISAQYQAVYTPDMGGSPNNYYSNSGTLTITSNNTSTGVIEGTFDFVGISSDPDDPVMTHNVTEGNFSVKLQ